MDLGDDLRECLNHAVVLDTMEHLLFLGTLAGVTAQGFWLAEADVHDCREGHAGKEEYIAEARREGISVNRKRVFVMRSAVCSLSRLDAIGADDEPPGSASTPTFTGRLQGLLTPFSAPRPASPGVPDRPDLVPSQTPEP